MSQIHEVECSLLIEPLSLSGALIYEGCCYGSEGGVLSSISVHFLFKETGRMISTIILHIDASCICIMLLYQ